jgi:hypothetical protein
MVLKSAYAATLCTGLLMLGGPALADAYKAGELLGLDLSALIEAAGPGRQIRSGSDRGQNRPQAGENGTRDCAKGHGAQDQPSACARRTAWRPHQADTAPHKTDRCPGALAEPLLPGMWVRTP